MLPRVVVYDPDLPFGRSASVAASSGTNAMACCVEALYAPDADPISSLIAEEGIRLLATGPKAGEVALGVEHCQSPASSLDSSLRRRPVVPIKGLSRGLQELVVMRLRSSLMRSPRRSRPCWVVEEALQR